MRDRPNDRHRAVASKKLGRALRPDEDVSHTDDNKANNSPANLEVMPHGKHSKHTGKTKGLRAWRKALTMHQRGERVY